MKWSEFIFVMMLLPSLQSFANESLGVHSFLIHKTIKLEKKRIQYSKRQRGNYVDIRTKWVACIGNWGVNVSGNICFRKYKSNINMNFAPFRPKCELMAMDTSKVSPGGFEILAGESFDAEVFQLNSEKTKFYFEYKGISFNCRHRKKMTFNQYMSSVVNEVISLD
jgi:hypothetical protein